MSVLNTLLKNTSTPFARTINDSFVTDNSEVHFPSDIPMLNVAFSGSMDKGYQSGVTVWAGPSKHFKSMYALNALDAFFKNAEDGVCLFYDSEYGITEDYLKQFPHIQDKLDRIIHIPITTVEELKHESSKQIEAIYDEYKAAFKKSKKADKPKVFILIDSIGQLASNKETQDSIDGKLTVDMTRAKAVKSFFRIVTSKVKMLGIPMHVIAHTYATMEMFSRQVVSSGCVIEGTKIIMADGSLKEIQNMTVDDKVKTLQGEQKVTAVWDPDTIEDGFPECYEIEFEDGNKYVVSDKHKLMDMNGVYVYVKDMVPGMEIKNINI